MFETPEFSAPWWLPSPHPQTVAGRFLRPRHTMPLRRERITTPDDDFLDLDFAPPVAADAPIVLLLHGLEGSAQRGYAFATYDELAKYGVASVGLNFRSCSGEPNLTARFYHSGETEDIRFVLRELRTRYPRAPIGAIGFSLGGNALLKFLGEEGAAAKELVGAAVAVSVPYDLAAGADHLDETAMGRFYTRIFVKPLVEKMERKRHLLSSVCDLERARRARSFREFDDAVTAPLHGFASAEDYYTRSSSAQFVPRIRVPTLLLHSEDDPFLPASSIPRAAIAQNQHVTASIQRQGGHVGFIYGTPATPRFWAEENAARFLSEHLVNNSLHEVHEVHEDRASSS
ncbi:MAG: YheT family hydrolase [Gemmatimonadota bacterium]